MAIIRDKSSNFAAVKQEEFVVDFESDLKKLPTTKRGALNTNIPDLMQPIPMGSKCYVIATGKTYILSSVYDWLPYMDGVVCEEPEDDEPVTPPSGGGGGTDPTPPPTSTGKTIYVGNLPTKWTDDSHDDTIDLVDEDVTVDVVTALPKLENKKTFAMTITCDIPDTAPSQWCIAYPKAWGNMNHAMVSGLDTMSNLVKKELEIDGEAYLVYYCVGTCSGTMDYTLS